MTKLKRIAGNVFYTPPDHSIDQPCLYAIAGSRYTLMIDGGATPALAASFVESLRAETGRGVGFLALTHWHWDHTFGLAGVNAPVIACTNTMAHLRRLAGYASWSDGALDARLASGEEIPFCSDCIRLAYPGKEREAIRVRLPDIVFDGRLTFDLGGVTCELFLLPAVHTNDCVAIHVPELRLLFIGDSTGQNSYDMPAHYCAPAVLELFRAIRELDPGLIMESHGEPADPEAFLTGNRILIDAANGVLSGCRTRESLSAYLQAACSHDLPEDRDEVVELFVNGVSRGE